jgi:serine protease Do
VVRYKILLIVMWLLMSIAVGVGVSGAARYGNKFENMVNASVLIYSDSGHASGVFIDDNVILTAAHCLEGEDTISIELSDGTVFESNDFYVDEQEDVGFIFVEADELSIAKLSDITGSIGDTVYHVGAPYHISFKFSLAGGIISHTNRSLLMPKWSSLLQTDIDGGPGSSGGPLYNSSGHLIGMYVGQSYRGGLSISFYEDINSILEAHERYEEEKSNS